MLKVNFSGHPVAGFEVAPLVGANLPTTTGKDLAEYIREILLSLPSRDSLLSGAAAEVILPGMAAAAAVVLAEWHGQYGAFPRIRWAVRGPSGFEWPEAASADLQSIRTSARTAR